MSHANGSLKAILYALGANFGIALAKSGAAWYTNSSAMLAEAIHSFADTANQVLLLLGLKRAGRPASAEHPLGYGKALFFYSFIVALLLFSAGGLFSIYEGVSKLLHPHVPHAPWVAVAVLAIAIALETVSLRAALAEVNRVRGRRYWAAELYRLPNGTVALNRMNGMTVYNSFSTDNGRTWTHNQTGGPNSVRFLDPVNGYGFSTVSTGWSVNTIGLNKTKDGGKTWERIGTVVDGAGIMPIRFVNGRLFVFTGQRLLSTADEGQTWNTEWPLKTLTSANAGGS